MCLGWTEDAVVTGRGCEAATCGGVVAAQRAEGDCDWAGRVEHIGVTLHSGVGLPPTADIHRTHRGQPFTTLHATSFS